MPAAPKANPPIRTLLGPVRVRSIRACSKPSRFPSSAISIRSF